MFFFFNVSPSAIFCGGVVLILSSKIFFSQCARTRAHTVSISLIKKSRNLISKLIVTASRYHLLLKQYICQEKKTTLSAVLASCGSDSTLDIDSVIDASTPLHRQVFFSFLLFFPLTNNNKPSLSTTIETKQAIFSFPE